MSSLPYYTIPYPFVACSIHDLHVRPVQLALGPLVRDDVAGRIGEVAVEKGGLEEILARADAAVVEDEVDGGLAVRVGDHGLDGQGHGRIHGQVLVDVVLQAHEAHVDVHVGRIVLEQDAVRALVLCVFVMQWMEYGAQSLVLVCTIIDCVLIHVLRVRTSTWERGTAGFSGSTRMMECVPRCRRSWWSIICQRGGGRQGGRMSI